MAKLERMIKLNPFASNDDFAVTCDLKVGTQNIEACFRVIGEIEDVFIPASKLKAERMDNLWESTCFEIFIGELDKEGYSEINVSPSGDWNAYSFTEYRQGMLPHKEIAISDFFNGQNLAEFRVGFTINARTSNLAIGACAIIKLNSGDKIYWANQHCGDKPDFHIKKSWTKI